MFMAMAAFWGPTLILSTSKTPDFLLSLPIPLLSQLVHCECSITIPFRLLHSRSLSLHPRCSIAAPSYAPRCSIRSENVKMAKDELEQLRREIRDLRDRVRSLEGQIDTLNAMIHSQEEELRLLKEDNNKLGGRLAPQDDLIAQQFGRLARQNDLIAQQFGRFAWQDDLIARHVDKLEKLWKDGQEDDYIVRMSEYIASHCLRLANSLSFDLWSDLWYDVKTERSKIRAQIQEKAEVIIEPKLENAMRGRLADWGMSWLDWRNVMSIANLQNCKTYKFEGFNFEESQILSNEQVHVMDIILSSNEKEDGNKRHH